MALHTNDDMETVSKGGLPPMRQSVRVTSENILLHFDVQGTLWVLPDNETIHHLDYRTVENYHVCDFNRDIEALADVYYSKSKSRIQQRYFACQVVRLLRAIVAREKTAGYVEQLNRLGAL